MPGSRRMTWARSATSWLRTVKERRSPRPPPRHSRTRGRLGRRVAAHRRGPRTPRATGSNRAPSSSWTSRPLTPLSGTDNPCPPDSRTRRQRAGVVGNVRDTHLTHTPRATALSDGRTSRPPRGLLRLVAPSGVAGVGEVRLLRVVPCDTLRLDRRPSPGPARLLLPHVHRPRGRSCRPPPRPAHGRPPAGARWTLDADDQVGAPRALIRHR